MDLKLHKRLRTSLNIHNAAVGRSVIKADFLDIAQSGGSELKPHLTMARHKVNTFLSKVETSS